MNLSTLYKDLAAQYGSTSGEMVFTFSDKGSMHSYIEFYERYFEPRRDRVELLEIGMMTGGSMHMWQRYFHDYRLVGIDLSPTWNQARPFQPEIEQDKKISLHFGINSRDANQAKCVHDQQFDFVIDDGDHTVLAQIDTFKNYWVNVKPGGVYFVEDVVGPVQIDILRKFLADYLPADSYSVEHYVGRVSSRADDQILAIEKS